MKSKLYESYVRQIENAVNMKQQDRLFNLGDTENRHRASNQIIKAAVNESRNLELPTGMHTLADLLGLGGVRQPFKGDHPHFAHIRKTGVSEYHYITSMFIDVKGSTRFHAKYDLEQIAMIIQTIVTAATHTIALFGGHVQRLQYDGVFCYFGGKNIPKTDAVKSAMDAASFFSYFIKYELKDVFELEGIEEVYTRIGIDFGDDKEVQWVVFGSEGCDELTTNSLHTSLAPKMQANAKANGIMIGQNVFTRLGTLAIYGDFLRNPLGNVDENQRYIYKDASRNFYYSQHTFDWVAYLKNSYWFISTSQDGSLYIDYSNKPGETKSKLAQLDRLFEKTAAMATGNASINTKGQIQPTSGGTIIPPNRFFYGSSSRE